MLASSLSEQEIELVKEVRHSNLTNKRQIIRDVRHLVESKRYRNSVIGFLTYQLKRRR